MRFIKTWAFSCSNYLMLQQKDSHEKRRVYYYGFQIIIGAIVKAVLLVSIALLLGVLQPSLIAIGVFASLRTIAGGYHMGTYGKCITLSLALFIVAGLVVKYTAEFWRTESITVLILLSFIAAFMVILKWVPADTPNKPITKPEAIKKFKNLSIVHIIVWVIITASLHFFGYSSIALASCFGLILEVFTITPVGYRSFSYIDGKVHLN